MTPWWLLLKADKKNITEDELNKIVAELIGKGLEVNLYTDIVSVRVNFYAPLDKNIPPEILTLPEHKRRSALTVYHFGRVTADEVASQTKRARAVESAYLNELCDRGYLKKERKGRKVYFNVEERLIRQTSQ